MPRLNRSIIFALAAVSGVFVLLAGGFALSRALGSERILGNVEVGNVELGGLDEDEARMRLVELEDQLVTSPAAFTVRGSSLLLDPATVGFDLDEQAIIDEAMTIGRRGDTSEQFRWWLGHFFSTDHLDPVGTIDPEAVDMLLVSWDEQAVGNPPFEGGIHIEGTQVMADYPKPGEQIDRETAGSLMLGAILTGNRTERVELPVTTSIPTLTAADVDRKVAEIVQWISAPVQLVAAPGVEVTFTEADIAAAIQIELVHNSPPSLVAHIDPSIVATKLEAIRDLVEAAPVDAQLEVDGDIVRVVPGTRGTLIDPNETARTLEIVAATNSRRGTLPFEEGADPEVTTEDLEALGITHLVSQFTTYHDCCQDRVSNIQLFADTIDGAIVMPGEQFSLNEFVGRRTSEKGYKPAGTIVAGELQDTVGGGVSQFATTFYNAVFWGGYEDITHKPHSFYFTRYPEGIEATISWPTPHLIFRNNTDRAILIKTEHSGIRGTSITVKFYSDNDGRIVKGDQRRGSTNIDVVAEGGPDARRVTGTVSGRYGYSSPPEPELRPNEALAEDEQKVIQRPAQGWSVTVTRTIEWQGETTAEQWVVRYRPKREIIEVHPCLVDPEDDILCPSETTTTTMAGGSSSTTSSTMAP